MLRHRMLNSCARAPKMWGLLKSDEELVIPFCKINKIGDDVILVDIML